MKRLILAALLLAAGAAHGQNYRAYSCPTAVLPGGQPGSTGVIDSRADTHTSCPTWSWAASSPSGAAIRRDAALPLVAVCATQATCNWNANNVRWRRPSAVLATDRIAVCAGTTNGDNCSPQSFQLRDVVLAPPAPVVEPPPPPPPQATVLVNATSGYTYETFLVRWESVNATRCRGSWTPADAPDLGPTGSNTIGPFLFPQRVDLTVTCYNAAGLSNMGGTTVDIREIAPRCIVDTWEEWDAHVKMTILPVNLWTPQYGEAVVTYFCATPTGQEQITYVIGTQSAMRKARDVLDGVLSIQQVRNDCNRDCRAIPPGPLDDWTQNWRKQFTPAQLGVISE